MYIYCMYVYVYKYIGRAFRWKLSHEFSTSPKFSPHVTSVQRSPSDQDVENVGAHRGAHGHISLTWRQLPQQRDDGAGRQQVFDALKAAPRMLLRMLKLMLFFAESYFVKLRPTKFIKMTSLHLPSGNLT